MIAQTSISKSTAAIRSLIFLSLSVWCCARAVAQLNDPPKWATDKGTPEADLIQGITSTDDCLVAAAAYRNLFRKLGADGIHNLLTQKSDSIALRAAWEEVNLTVAEQEPPNVVRPDRGRLERFVGFLEGRARVKAPQWWIDAVLESKANRRDNIYLGFSDKHLYHESGFESVRCPLDTTLEAKSGAVVLRIAKDSVSIPLKLLQDSHFATLASNVSAVFTTSRCYVAAHDDNGFSYVLFCLDRSSGLVKWKSEVWGSWAGGMSGPCGSWVTVTEQDDRVVVFGAACMGFNVEAFRSDDGKNLFRVSNTF